MACELNSVRLLVVKGQKLKIRLRSPWKKRIECSNAIFSVDIPVGEADALLVDWGPDEELFSFSGRKAWYCCEPKCQFEAMGSGLWTDIRGRLAPEEFLYHGHPNPEYRVPHVTHFQPLEMVRGGKRKQKAIAIVSNHGGSPRIRHPQIADRNQFITHPDVDLFGRSSWQSYRKHLISWPRPPQNYVGELPGDWPADGKRKLMAEYKVAVCMENMCEPYYFTEKLVEAVVAGCIPVYRAGSEIRKTVLAGAFWVDPADHGDSPETALQYAMNADLEQVQNQNADWLRSSALGKSHSAAVFERIGRIFQHTLDLTHE